MQLDPRDPLLTVKVRALRPLLRKSTIPWDQLTAAEALQAARALSLREEEAGSSCSEVINPRNEAAALSLLYKHVEGVCGKDSATWRQQLDQLAADYTSRCCTAHDAALSSGGTARELKGNAEGELLRWAQSQGADVSNVQPAMFADGLRGLTVTRHTPAGDLVLQLPASCLITTSTAASSDLGKMLARLPGMGEEQVLVVWTMVERWEPEAAAAAFWRALPDQLGTGLSQPSTTWQLVEGTAAAHLYRRSHQHIMQQYDALQPVFKTLLAAYPDYFKQEWFTPEAYLWAVELWYAYAIQVQLPGGEVTPALVPVASLINHSPTPHVVHFSAVDAATQQLQLRCFRPIEPGQQLLLSYGPLSNEHLLVFYGFAVAQNPFDTLELDWAQYMANQAQQQQRQLLGDNGSQGQASPPTAAGHAEPASSGTELVQRVQRVLKDAGVPATCTLTQQQPLPAGLVQGAAALAAAGLLPGSTAGSSRDASMGQAAVQQVLQDLESHLQAAAKGLVDEVQRDTGRGAADSPFVAHLREYVTGQLQLLDLARSSSGACI